MYENFICCCFLSNLKQLLAKYSQQTGAQTVRMYMHVVRFYSE